MDHLPRPSRPIHSLLEVPYLDTEVFDGGDYETYPQRRGWMPRGEIEWYHLFDNPTPEFQGFLQTWLFFAPIEKTIGRKNIRQSALIRQVGNPPRSIVDTSPLIELEQLWSDNITSSVRSRDKEIVRTLTTHNEFLSWLYTASPSGDPSETSSSRQDAIRTAFAQHWSLGTEVATFNLLDYVRLCPVPRRPMDPVTDLSICLLNDLFVGLLALPSLASHPTLSIPQYADARLSRSNLLPRWESFVTSRMRQQDGWCPFQISMLHERLQATSLYFTSDIRRPDAASHIAIDVIIDDQGRRTQDNLKLCSASRCELVNINPDTYHTQHRGGCSGCPLLGIDTEEVLEILEGGFFPLVLLLDDDDDEDVESLQIIESSAETSFVAVSHVWSDGLGNQNGNSLPRCQLRYISRQVRAMPGPASEILLIWLDTLCVPRRIDEGARIKHARKLAIGRMYDTYKAADAVLVLDKSLMTRNIANFYDSEVLLTVLSSNWNTRLWTLQEGVLAKQLFFVFEDQVYYSDRGLYGLHSEERPFLKFTLKPVIFARFKDFRVDDTAELFSTRIISVAQALKSRTTSFGPDEAICLATLLGLDVRRILDTEPDMRMIVLWSMAPTAPQHFIFYNQARLAVDGLRWAPASLLRTGLLGNRRAVDLPNHWDQVAEGKVTDEGLLVTYPGYIVKIAQCAVQGHNFYFIDNNGQWFRVILNLSAEDENVLTYERDKGISISTRDPFSVLSNKGVTGAGESSFASLAIITDNLLSTNNQRARGLLAVPILPDHIPSKFQKKAAEQSFYETYLASATLKVRSICVCSVHMVNRSAMSAVLQAEETRLSHKLPTLDEWRDARDKTCVMYREPDLDVSIMTMTGGIQTNGEQKWLVD